MAGRVLVPPGMCLRGSGWHGHAHTVGEWVGKAAGGASGGEWQATSWRCLARAYAGQAGTGMHVPWGNVQVRQQGEPQVASGRLHPGVCLRRLGWHAMQACAYPMYDRPENLWGCYTAAADEQTATHIGSIHGPWGQGVHRVA